MKLNAVVGQKLDVLIELPNWPRNNVASGGEDDEDKS